MDDVERRAGPAGEGLQSGGPVAAEVVGLAAVDDQRADETGPADDRRGGQRSQPQIKQGAVLGYVKRQMHDRRAAGANGFNQAAVGQGRAGVVGRRVQVVGAPAVGGGVIEGQGGGGGLQVAGRGPEDILAGDFL